MTASEMIPDCANPEHDSRYWCLPPVRDEPSEGGQDAYPMYLVTQGKAVGVWHNWTVVKAMVDRYPSGAQRGHQTMEGCIAEWQQHCLLGVHPHPANPKKVEAALSTAIHTIPGPTRNRGRRVEPGLQAQMKEFCMPDLSHLSLAESATSRNNQGSTSSTISSTSSITATTWDEVPELVRYFALWGGRIVFTDRTEAKRAFLQVEAEGEKPSILSTTNYDEAQAFSESVYCQQCAWSRHSNVANYEHAGPDTSATPPTHPTASSAPGRVIPTSPTTGIPPGPDTSATTPLHADIPDELPLAPEIVTAVKTKRPRRSKGVPKAKTGKLSWVHGTKKKFFARRKEEWLREAEKRQAGTFYTKMAKLYIRKYGYHLGDDQDLAVDVDDPRLRSRRGCARAAVRRGTAVAGGISEKLERCKWTFRIGQWYRAEYGSLLKSDKNTFKELFTGALDGTPPKPQRGRILHFYSRNFYEARIKERVEERIASLKRRAQLSGESEREGERMPIDLVAKVTAEVWAEETPAFQRECEVAMEREYQQTLKAWEASLADSPTRSAEEIAATLENAAFYLQPFVDAIQERFGMCASILLAGPIGIRGGRIGVQSVHAGVTKGLAPVNWPTFDWKGFQEAEKSMIGFARECYSNVICQSGYRVLCTSIELAGIRIECRQGGASQATLTSAAQAQVLLTGVVAASISAPTAGAAPVSAQMGMEEGVDDDGDSGRRHHDSDGLGGGEEMNEDVEEYWQRDDREKWTEELGRAHAAFEQGRGWGKEWAVCIQKFFDFESEWGFTEGGWQMPRKDRPEQVREWINRGRKWTLPPTLGSELGTRETGDLWVGGWWKWWGSLQPEERGTLENELLRPETADWSKMAGMYGKNGLLQVMATLVWWGDVARKRGLEAEKEWLAAILESGEIKKDKDQGTKRKRKGGHSAAKGNNAAKEDGGDNGNVESPQKKMRRGQAPPEITGLRRANRLSGAVPDEDGSRRTTRSKSGMKAGDSKRKGKDGDRPKPRPLYKKRF
ncbi:hypothetical protein B0H14DRAFT_3573811 [Mycena olivaceomarginata]|nr:hypothetical protein B0H14DRAFT_3573811 [Mycena olivaceomarginata]